MKRKLKYIIYIMVSTILASCGRNCEKFKGSYVRGYEWGELAQKTGYYHTEKEVKLQYGVGLAENALPCLCEGYRDGYKGNENRYEGAPTTVWAPPKNETAIHQYIPEPEKEEPKPVTKKIEEDKEVEKTCTVTGDNVNVRSAPEKLSDVIYRASKGESVKLDKAFKPKPDVVNGKEGSWRMIQYDKDGLGWIFDVYISCP